MYDKTIIKSILSRLLSTEIANQERWEEDDIKKFGKSVIDRHQIIDAINEYMNENDIPFNLDYYINA